MKSGFTLIEVLVATVIASIAGMALLQMNSNNTHLFKQIQYRSSNSEPVSLIALHSDKKYNRSTKSLYDILDRTYDIKNDDLRKYLKDYKIDYNEQLIETIKFDEAESDDSESDYISEESDASAPIIQFELIQIIAKTEQGQNAVLTARLVE
ncbi:MAG: prepilin-type N-terminal cleavage/methylation domain-containing protein [Campylobacterota bacterium]|nr:prepilin-type N-terminal cleavage/methylation domain-containing protein [Campylobacterota bacterium]